jgi:hypothetical protein
VAPGTGVNAEVVQAGRVNQEFVSFQTEAAGRLRPNFLCIGQPHAGTAWLRRTLATHPQIQLPNRCGDYFSFNYHRGERWYLAHFAGGHGRAGVRQTGEVGPMYLYSDLAPSRIAAFRSVRKFIVTFRDPMSWLAARYGVIRRRSRSAGDRACFLEHHSHEFDRLHVHSFLALYLALFDRERFLFVTADEVATREDAVKRRVAEFLDVDSGGFGRAGARTPVFGRLFARKEPRPPAWLYEELRARRLLVNEQTERLGAAIGRDLSGWLID